MLISLDGTGVLFFVFLLEKTNTPSRLWHDIMMLQPIVVVLSGYFKIR